jgi:hypothetical protein
VVVAEVEADELRVRQAVYCEGKYFSLACSSPHSPLYNKRMQGSQTETEAWSSPIGFARIAVSGKEVPITLVSLV